MSETQAPQLDEPTAKQRRPSIVEFSDNFTNIASALVRAVKKFDPIKADQIADIQSERAKFKYHYADLNGIIQSTRKYLAEEGIVLVQGPTTADNSTLVSVETVLLHESGEWIRSRLSLKTQQSSPQGVGSSITYARRYAQQAMLNVASVDDDGAAGSTGANDGNRGGQRQTQQRQQRPANTTQTEAPKTATASGPAPAGMVGAIRRLIGDLNLGEEEVVHELTEGAKSSVESLTFGEGNAMLQSLQRQKAERK